MWKLLPAVSKKKKKMYSYILGVVGIKLFRNNFFFLHWVFTPIVTAGLGCRLSDNKSPRYCSTLCNLTVFSNAIVWIVILLLFSIPYQALFSTLPSILITTGTFVTFLFQSVFSFLARARDFAFSVLLWSVRMVRSTI